MPTIFYRLGTSKNIDIYMARNTIGLFYVNPYSAADISLDNLLNTTNSEMPTVEPMKILRKFLKTVDC
jgi:hypothetical protein